MDKWEGPKWDNGGKGQGVREEGQGQWTNGTMGGSQMGKG